jgi:hypothetical protein
MCSIGDWPSDGATGPSPWNKRSFRALSRTMATARDLRKICLSLEGTVEAPHFDRQAFKVKRIFATLAADGLTANLKFTPDEQEFKCMLAPEAFQPVPNAWGRQGYTTVTLARITAGELRTALEMAWRHAQPKPKSRR